MIATTNNPAETTADALGAAAPSPRGEGDRDILQPVEVHGEGKTVPKSAPSTLNSQPSTNFHLPQARGESDRAFEAFRSYWELGPRRRYAAVGRKVGVSLRTVKRWASDFDWRGRIKTCATQLVQQRTEIESVIYREDRLDAAARAKAFRDRQYVLAEALLDTAEHFLENVDPDDLDQLSFTDACKALEIASRLGHQATAGPADASIPARGLKEQLTSLLNQVFRDSPTQPSTGPNGQPGAASSITPS